MADVTSNGRGVRTYRANSVVPPLNEYARQMAAVLWSVLCSSSTLLRRSLISSSSLPISWIGFFFVTD
jgi:hypothetical protein